MRANEKRRALYDAVSAIDPALVQEATSPRHRKVTRIVWRVAATAAVVALLIGAMVLPIKDGASVPFFTIHVHANETETIELSADKNGTVISNVPPTDTESDSLNFDSAPSSSKKTLFFVDIWLDTDLSIFMPDRKDERPYLTVVCNGEIVDPQSKNIMIGFVSSPTNDEVGYSVAGQVDKPTLLEVILTAPDNTMLQKCVVLVTPALSGGYVVKLLYTYVTDAYEIGI